MTTTKHSFERFLIFLYFTDHQFSNCNKMIIKFYLPFPKEFFNKSVRVGPEQPQIIITNIRGETKRLFKEGYDGAMEICHVTGIGTACGAII